MAANIVVVSSFDAKGFQQAQRDLDRLKAKTENTSSKIAKIGGNIAGGLAVVGAAVGGFAVAQTAKLEDSQAALENAFKNAGTSLEDQKGKLSGVQDKLEKYGYTNAQVNEVVARMTTVTGSADKALGSMSLAADIAKNRHIDLSSAGDLLSKAMAGNVIAAKRMGISIPDSILKMKDPTEKASAVMEILQGHFKGSADAAGDTFGGKMEAAKAKISDVAAKIGEKLVPFLTKLLDKLLAMGKWLGSHKEIMLGILIAVGLALGTMLVMWVVNTIAAMSFWTAATGGIILLVAALAAGIIWIVHHWNEVWGKIKAVALAAWHFLDNNVIHPIVSAFTTAWDAIQGAFMSVWNWLSSNWPLLLAIITGPIGLAVYFVMKYWDDIVGFFSGLIGTIGGIFSSIGNAIWNGIKFGINLAIDALNALISGANKVTGVISFGTIPKIPPIPKLAQGGPVTAGNPYIVGDGGGPELFVPSQSGTIVPNGKFGGGGSVVNNITINATSADPQAVVNALRKYMQRNGTLAGAGIK